MTYSWRVWLRDTNPHVPEKSKTSEWRWRWRWRWTSWRRSWSCMIFFLTGAGGTCCQRDPSPHETGLSRRWEKSTGSGAQAMNEHETQILKHLALITAHCLHQWLGKTQYLGHRNIQSPGCHLYGRASLSPKLESSSIQLKKKKNGDTVMNSILVNDKTTSIQNKEKETLKQINKITI